LCAARQDYYQQLADFEAGNIAQKPVHPSADKKKYAHKQVKTYLQRMFGQKCAYCESLVTAVAYQHVEHFRPQSIYPYLAYEWYNLLLACEVCNSGHKGNQFPLMDASQPEENRSNPCARDGNDANALVNPCFDNPEDFFDFDDEWLLCRNNNLRAQYTRDVCGLNRDDLRDARRMVLDPITAVAEYLLLLVKNRQQNADRIRNLATRIQKYTESSSPYSAMVSSKLRSLGINLAELL